MNDYIDDFADQLKEAMDIGESSIFKKSKKKFKNVLICGLGGSGIGGTIINDIVSPIINIPVLTTKDYSIPNFVDQDTLAIVSSYSGNTEETLYAMKKCHEKKSEICVVTSGGKLKSEAKNNNYNSIIIPGGHPPRAMFAYAFTEIFYILNHYEIIDDSFKKDYRKSIKILLNEKKKIQKKAISVAKKIYNNTPVIYASQGFEGVAVRFRQQINENSKTLCWHHVVPEMNHNELLGWRTNTNDLAVIYFRNKLDFKRNQIRIEINKKVISKYTNNITEIWSKGNTVIENTLYHIHLGDWISWYLSELKNIDAIEIDVINFLKDELSKV